MVAVLVALTAAGGWLGVTVAARHRVQAAADLAALAAAAGVAEGPARACARAEAIATAMRTAVAGCAVEGLDVVVSLQAPVTLGRMGVGVARAAARAGPAGADG